MTAASVQTYLLILWLIFLEVKRTDPPIQLLCKVALRPECLQFLHARNVLDLDNLLSDDGRRSSSCIIIPILISRWCGLLLLFHKDGVDGWLLLMWEEKRLALLSIAAHFV